MPSKELAEKICKELGGQLTEMHLFYPERYKGDLRLEQGHAECAPQDQLPCNLPDEAKVREAVGQLGRNPPDFSREMS